MTLDSFLGATPDTFRGVWFHPILMEGSPSLELELARARKLPSISILLQTRNRNLLNSTFKKQKQYYAPTESRARNAGTVQMHKKNTTSHHKKKYKIGDNRGVHPSAKIPQQNIY